MYNRRIKKAILFFHAAVITCAFCLGSRAQAASASLAFNFSPSTYNAYLIYSENIDYEDNGSGVTQVSGNPTYVYECTIPVFLTISSSDCYIYGNLFERYSLTATIPTGFQQASIDISYEDGSPDFVYSGMTNRGASPLSYTIGIRAYFTDFFSPFNSSGTVQLGTITYRISLKSTGSGATHNPYITVSIGSAGSLSNSTTISATPSGMQYTEIFKQSILDALNTDVYDTQSIVDILAIYEQYMYAADIRQEVIDQNIQTLVADLTDVISRQDLAIQKLTNILTAISQFQSSYNSATYDWILPALTGINDKLNQLIIMGQSETEGASEAESAAAALGNQLDYLAGQPTLSDNQVFDGINQGAAAYGEDASNIYFWAWDSRIAGILGIVMSLALIGFIIYGKSG